MTLEELLKTGDVQKQVDIVSGLINAAQADPISLTAVINPATGRVSLMLNKNLGFDDVYTLLDVIRKDVTRREREALLQKPAE